jgi:hypothetical protein
MLGEPINVRPVEGSICETVVNTVADARGVDPLNLEPPLYEAIDPDALERIATAHDSSVAFTMAGYRVIVHGSDRVVVCSEDGSEAARQV